MIIYMMRHKDEFFGIFKHFHAIVEKEVGKSSKCIQIDNRGNSGSFEEY